MLIYLKALSICITYGNLRELLLMRRCDMVDDKLAAAITAGALGIIVLLFGGNVVPLDASSNLN